MQPTIMVEIWSETVASAKKKKKKKIWPCLDTVSKEFENDTNDSLKSFWKRCFISSKKLFLFLRYSNFCISLFALFLFCQPLLKKMIKLKLNLKIYGVINWLNKNLKTCLISCKGKLDWYWNLVIW